MGRPSKIDDTKLAEMLREGKGTKECAKHFNVSQAAVSQAKGRIKVRGSRAMGPSKKAEVIINDNIDAVAQLKKINQDANEILDLVMRWNRGDDEALQVLESQVKRIKIGKGEEASVKEVKFKDPRELALKAMAEIRNQLKLQLEIYEMLHDMKAVQEFQETVIEVMSEYDPDVRTKILDRLQEKRAIRSAVQFGS